MWFSLGLSKAKESSMLDNYELSLIGGKVCGSYI
jgi:hypothetical protein